MDKVFDVLDYIVIFQYVLVSQWFYFCNIMLFLEISPIPNNIQFFIKKN